ncbi:hypothetical protein V8C42DRAFT_40315 [Trichoderma barbatum]
MMLERSQSDGRAGDATDHGLFTAQLPCGRTTPPRDSLFAAAAVKIVAPHAPGAWWTSEGSLLFVSISRCHLLACGKFCGENLAGEAEAFWAKFLFCYLDCGRHAWQRWPSSASFVSRSSHPRHPSSTWERGVDKLAVVVWQRFGLCWHVARGLIGFTCQLGRPRIELTSVTASRRWTFRSPEYLLRDPNECRSFLSPQQRPRPIGVSAGT